MLPALFMIVDLNSQVNESSEDTTTPLLRKTGYLFWKKEGHWVLKDPKFCMSEFGRRQSSQCNWPNWLIEKKFLRLWKKREKYKRENYVLIYNGRGCGISGKQKNIKMHTLKSYYLPFVDNLLLMQTASRDVGEIAGSGLMLLFLHTKIPL